MEREREKEEEKETRETSLGQYNFFSDENFAGACECNALTRVAVCRGIIDDSTET